MGKWRYATAVLILSLALASTGCMKTWSIDFTNDSGGWRTLLAWDAPGITSSGDYGLMLSGTTLRGDFGFDGDVEYSVVFDLNLGTTGEVQEMEIYLGDGYDPAVKWIKCKFVSIGDGSSEAYFLYDAGELLHGAGNIIGLVKNGRNTFYLKIIDGVANFLMNETNLFGPCVIENYDNPLLIPYILVQQGSLGPGQETEDALLLIKRLTVKYSGSKQSIIGP